MNLELQDAMDAPDGREDEIFDDYDFDELDAYEELGAELERELSRRDRAMHRAARKQAGRGARLDRSELIATVAEADDSLETGFSTSYQPSKHERGWLYEALSPFYLQGELTDVLRMVKGGKEACVYECATSPNLGGGRVAAKIYRPRRFRNLRNDARYRRGRQSLDADGKLLRDDRAQRAIFKGTARGKELAHSSWLAHELNALRRLHDAGADVPEPYASGPNVILMAYLGDDAGPAPPLSQIELGAEEAGRLLARCLDNIERMLECDIVHGDLSAYNVLYLGGQIHLIDFPQVVDPHANPEAREIFDRDVLRICQYFASQGVDSDPAALAEEIWTRALDFDPYSDPQRLPSELSMLDHLRQATEEDEAEE